MTKLLELIPEYCVPRSNNGVKFDRIPVRPGINYQLTPLEVDKVIAHPDFQRYAANGSIKIIESVVDPLAIEIEPQAPLAANLELSGFKVGEGDEETGGIIRRTSTIAILDRWLEKETRKSVQGQLQRRIAAIKKGEI
ncbi:hypothetical protein H6F86_20470 [Phormidium sp. FACHB-592]|uniref:Uncharacterized protein n=1 Tax=Stenomitos frigidus AS-A4 TaxID=2933935 RepID=A0ABV0KED6_9CYAN|nr:hypothetical protein [Phormidium sp. FACHB-592]MBD2076207.1 hypothetical protein [Phormidium sp. FACHB-592]